MYKVLLQIFYMWELKKLFFKLWQNIHNIKVTILLIFCYSSIALRTLTLLYNYHT